MENLPESIFSAPKFWAIPLSNSIHRKWDNQENYNSLMFNWEDIPISGSSSLNDISIEVAKKYAKDESEKIRSIANGIFNFSRVKDGDGILGIEGNRIVKKIGFVDSNNNSVLPYEIELNIKWIDEIQEGKAENEIFNSTLEIQKVTLKMLEQLKLQIIVSRNYYEKLSMHDEFIKEIPNIKLQPIVKEDLPDKEENAGKISLFYGTNRNVEPKDNLNDHYGNDLTELKFGFCEVSIPRGHTQGEIERPSIWKLEFSEKEKKHVLLTDIIELEEGIFFNKLNEELNSDSEKSALVFIHGYNNTFAEAARRTAQIAWDIPFNGIAGFFSWASDGKTLSYLKDIEQADASIPFFEELLEKLLDHTNIEKLHLIAHSMGNRLLTVTLNNLSLRQALSNKLKLIKQIVLAAPDIDQKVFRNNILPQFQTLGSRRTLYSSDLDKTLQVSENIRRGLARLGDAGNSLFVERGIDTVDASNIKSSGNNHSYIFETKELLSDLFYLLNHELSPIERRLRARNKHQMPYWLFPK